MLQKVKSKNIYIYFQFSLGNFLTYKLLKKNYPHSYNNLKDMIKQSDQNEHINDRLSKKKTKNNTLRNKTRSEKINIEHKMCANKF